MVSKTSQRNVLLASALGSSLAPFMVAGLLVALPTIGQEFAADASLLGWLTNGFFLAAAVFLVPVGRVADVRGAKKVFTFGIGIYAIAVTLCAISPHIFFLIAARFLTGIGAAMIFGTSIALLSLVYPLAGRGRAIGINVTAMSLGFLLGFFLGGLLTFYVGWRSIFAVTLPIEFLILWLIFSRIRGECELTREKELDLPGMILYGSALFLIVSGFSSLTHFTGLLILGGGLVILSIFVFQESRTPHPLFDPRIFLRNRTYATANLTVLLFNASNFALIFIITLYLQSLRQIDVRLAGVILLVPVIFMFLFSTYAGRLSDRIPPRRVVGSGLVCATMALFLFTVLDEQTSLLWILAALFLYGLGIALCQAPLVRTSVSAVPRQMTGLASGMIETMRLVGMTVSVAISIFIFTLFVGDSPVIPALHEQYLAAMREIFWIFIVLSLSALSIAVLFLKRSPETQIEGGTE